MGDDRAAFTNYRSLFARAVEGPSSLSVSGTDPAVGSVVFAQRTTFTVNVNQPVDATTYRPPISPSTGPRDYRYLHTRRRRHHLQLHDVPMTTQGVQTMHIAEGAFLSASGGNPVAINSPVPSVTTRCF